MSKIIINFSRFTSKIMLSLSAIFLVVITILVFYQVVTRFILGAPSTWSEITARLMMVWMVYLSMSCVFQQGSMIAIGFFVDKLPGALGLWMKRTVTLIILLFLGVLIFYGWEMAVRVQNQNVSMINISAFWLYVSIPFGALMSIPNVFEWHLLNVENCADLDVLKIDDIKEL